ncbi:MAG: TOMM precursor leader peptide-binding protein [Bacillota bacterium]|nr:TOMM precursor leader peptide-binding protein [Bacillota bacterium]
MNGSVLVVGTGLLAEYVKERLSSKYNVILCRKLEEVPKETEFALILDDAWHPGLYHEAEKIFQTAEIPWLRSFVSFGEGITGPIILPNRPGCSSCVELRRLIAGPDRRENWELRNKLSLVTTIKPDGWASRLGLLQMSFLIEREVQRFFDDQSEGVAGHIFITNLKTLETSKHVFLPDPLCPVCGNLPDDTPELANIRLESSLKIKEDSYRCRSIDDLKEVLSKDYLDFRTGVMNFITRDNTLPFADVIVNMPLFGADEGTAGRTHSYEMSAVTAILEGLERYCGLGPRGKRRVVRDSYQNVNKNAMNPLTIGLHEQNMYKNPHFPFKSFNPKEPMNWVWGFSLLQNRPILVPELLAYYSLGNREGFVYETSNGCALGGSLEEAIFHGILEVVERDSFLLTWYARLQLPRLDLNSANDQELVLMVERLREVANYDVYFYNSTMEHGIPSVWGIAKNRGTKGLNIICAAGANPDPVNAIKSALFELAGMMYHHDEKFADNRTKYVRMLDHPFEVETMEDHGMLYGLPEAEERLNFLLNEPRPIRTIADEFKPRPGYLDLKDEVNELLERFRGQNLDVIVVDQTTPEIKRNGLSCVKVIIPGMLPMTFGHHLIRVRGLERVLTIPSKLGYTKHALTYEELNPYPHPFP